MYQQCLFAKKGEEISVQATVPFALYYRLFAKPLMLIGMENALSLIEQHPSRDSHHLAAHSASPARAPGKSGSHGVVWPEMDTSSLGQTMAVIGFNRKFMKNVFTSDELDHYLQYKREAHNIRKMRRQRALLDPSVNPIREEAAQDPLKLLEAYRASKQGIEEPKPYGIEKDWAINTMSIQGHKDLERKK